MNTRKCPLGKEVLQLGRSCNLDEKQRNERGAGAVVVRTAGSGRVYITSGIGRGNC